MAIKQPALILERERRKKKKESEVTPKVNKPTKEVVKNNKGTTHINRATISTKPGTQNNTQNRVLTNKERLTSKPTISNVNKDIRTVKTSNKPKRSIQTVDVYERGGKYYYKDGKKEKQVDTKFVQNALNNNRSGVIGRYNSKGRLVETDESGNVKSAKGVRREKVDNLKKQLNAWGDNIKKGNISVSQAITDAANTFDAATDFGLGNFYKNAAKTEINAFDRFWTGSTRKLEGLYDMASDATSAITSAQNYVINRARGMSKKNAEKQMKEEQKANAEWVSRDLVNDFKDKTGYNKIQPSLEEGSLVKKDNTAGQLIEGLGGMFPDIAFAQATGLNIAPKSLEGLTGLQKAGTFVSNMGRRFASQAGANAVLGASSYGSGLEEAYRNGATGAQARTYGLLNAANELATEWATGGIPGTKTEGALDGFINDFIDKKTAKISNKFVSNVINAFAKGQARNIGEGFEEAIAEMISPHLKNLTYSSGEKVDYNQVKNSFFMGYAISTILNSPQSVSEIRQGINDAKFTPEMKKQLNEELSALVEQSAMSSVLSNGVPEETAVSNMRNQLQQQANEVKQRVDSGEIEAQEGNVLLDQVRDGTYQQNRNLEQIATQRKAVLEEQFRQGQINQGEYIQGVQALANTVNQTREEINTPKELQGSQNITEQNYEGLNQKEYNEIQRRYKDLIETTGFEEDFVENAKPSDILGQLKSIKELYEGDEGFLYEAKNWESPEVYKDTKSQYDKINRLINRFEGKINQQQTKTTNTQQESTQESTFNNVKLEERVSGDKLLDAQDFINEVKNVGAKVDDKGYVTVYHQTTPKNAQKILDSGKMTSNEQAVYFSTSEKASQADGRGDVKLEFKIPAEDLELDDLFSDNADVKINLNGAKDIDVSNYLVNNNQTDNVETNKVESNASDKQFNVDLSKMPVYKKIYKNAFDENGNFRSFKQQLKDFFDKKTYKGEKLLVSPNNEGLEYTKIQNKPIEITEHAINSHDVPKSIIENIDNELKNSVLALDSTTIDGAKVVILNKYDINGNPYIAAIHQKDNKVSVEVNKLSSIYEKNNIQEFINDTLDKGKKVYTNEKTNDWLNFNRVQFPEESNSLVLNENIQQNNKNVNIPAKVNDNVISADSITKDFDNAKKGKLDDKKIRSYIGTSNEATGMQETIKNADVDIITYEVQSNQETYKTAQNNIKDLSYDERVSRSKNILNSNKKVTAVDMAEAQIALLEAAQSGNVEDYLNLQQDIAIMGTELGQTIQSMSMIQKMSPDGQIATLLKIVNRKQKTGNKAWEDVKLNPDLVQKVLDSYDDVSHTTYNQEQMEQAVDELKQDLADQMKVSRTEKLNEWRYLSMLGNPKTHIRNLAGNVGMSVVKSIKDEISAAGQDVAGALGLINKEQKTATLKRASKEVKELSDVAFKEMMRVDDKGSKYVDAGIIEQKRKIFNNRVLEFLRKGNLKALNVEDNWFKKTHFKKSFSTYLTAKGISTVEDINKNPQIVADAKVYAMNEAKIATFQQDNAVADWIRDLDKLGKGAEVIRGAIVPFTGVPMNIAKTGIEYTPVTGMLKTVSDFRKAPKGEKGIVLIDGLAKQMTGSALAILGYALAKSGFVTADAGDDKEDKYQKDLGAKMNYSIKIGKTSYDLSWLSPSSMPFFVGASAYEQWEKNEGLDANFVTEALTSTIDPLSEMSVISSFTDIMKGFSQNDAEFFKNAGEKSIQSYLSQYLPTVFSQFSRALDSKKRNTYADKNSKWKFGEETGKQLAYKTPFRFLLPEQTDYFGNTKMDEENNLSRGLQSFLSPVNVKKDTSNKVSNELMKLHKETGDSEVIPGKADNYVDYKNEKYEMTQREYNKFKKDYGTLATKEINRALEDTKYQELSKDKQAQVISNILKYSEFKAKDNFLSSKGVDYTNTQFNKAKQAQESGYAIADYYITKKVTAKEKSETTSTNRYMEMKNKGIDGRTFDEFKAFVSTARADKTRNGGYIPGSKKQKIINYIQGLPLSAKQKQALWEDYQKNTG